MLSLRGFVAVPAILVYGLLADATAQPSAGTAPKPDAKAILDRVRDTYRNLPSYHFDRVLLVQEARSDGKLANIAELTLTIATENAKPEPDGYPLPLNLDRFRLGTQTKQGEMLQVCDGRTCWSYTPLKNEYMAGNRFRDLNTSVGGSMLLAHLFTFLTLLEGTVQDAKVVREEEVEVGKERRKCYVIEGVIWPKPPPRGPGKPPALGAPGVEWLVSMLTLEGLAGEVGARLYSPWPFAEKAAGVAAPTQVTFWIDQNAHVVVRSRMAAQLYKVASFPGQVEPGPVEKVAVTVTDSFTTAAVEAPPDDLFRFTPPKGAKEVPNAASRRENQN